MTDNEERIRRMEADGVLSPQQAEMLRASLARQPSLEPRRRFWTPERGRIVLWTIGGLLAVGLLAAILLAGGPGDVQDVAETLNHFLMKTESGWALDLVTMHRVIRFGRSNAWRLAERSGHPYASRRGYGDNLLSVF